jgi:hypothetical protein
MVYPSPGSVAVRVTEPVPQRVSFADIAEPGKAFTVTAIALLVSEQLFSLVTVTVYEPDASAVYDEAVAPVIFVPFNFHWYDNPDPVLADKTTEPPSQKVVGADPAEIVAVGNAFTIISTSLLDVQPAVDVAVAVYVVVSDGFAYTVVAEVPKV